MGFQDYDYKGKLLFDKKKFPATFFNKILSESTKYIAYSYEFQPQFLSKIAVHCELI